MIVRIPTFGHEWVAWVLDAGAAAIVIPHVSQDDSESVIDADSDVSFSPKQQSRHRKSLKQQSRSLCYRDIV